MLIRRTALVVLLFAAMAPVLTRGGAIAATCDATASPSNVQSRIDAAGAGDVVCLGAGVFRGPIVVAGKSGITISGAGKFQTIVAGGQNDGIVIIDSEGVTVEDLTLYAGKVANAYVGRSTDVVLRRLDIGAGGIGVHVDDASTAMLSESFISAMTGDGVLLRRGSGALIERNWIFNNAGVGVSAVGNTGVTSLVRNIISDNRGPGIFAGAPPCAGLPGASLSVPACFTRDPGAYIASAQLTLDTNIIQASGSTGIVLFPGTRATMQGNRVWRNHMTGLFAWGADVTSSADDYDGNDEHAMEIRGYPDPRAVGPGYRGASAHIDNTDVRNTLVWPQTGTLGGGVLAQGAIVDLTNSRVYGNAGVAVSYQTGSTGRVDGNAVHDNRGAAICLLGAGSVIVGLNQVFKNATDKVGAC